MSPIETADESFSSLAGGQIYACLYCDFEDEGRSEVVDHMESMHQQQQQDGGSGRHRRSGGSAERTCLVCQATLASGEALIHHMKYQHGNIRGHRCPWCGQLHKQPEDLRQHALQQHKQKLGGNLDYLIVKN